MKLSEVKEKVLKGELVIENDMPKSEKTIKVLNYIEEYTWSCRGERYGYVGDLFDLILAAELKEVPSIKVSQIDLEEEVTYTREQAEQVLKHFRNFTWGINGLKYEFDEEFIIEFLDTTFETNTVELTEEELKTYYEEKEGKKVIIKKD